MERVILNRRNSKIEFELQSADSSLHIEQVRIIRMNEHPQVLPWSDFAKSIELRAKFSCTVYDDAKGCFVDERTEEVVIPLVPDLSQPEPVIPLNQRLQNRLFTVGLNSEQRHFNRLSLEVCNGEKLSEDDALEFLVEKME
jgi:hypothetical protein